jgi:hypothetical protein
MEMRCCNCVHYNNGSCLKIKYYESDISYEPNDKAYILTEGLYGERSYGRLEVSADFGCILFEERLRSGDE